MSASTDWPALIGEMILTKNEILELDPTYYDDYTLPGERASESTVANLEQALGERLPDEYRDFLLHANGWKMFYWDADLFEINDLAQGLNQSAAAALISTYRQEGVLTELGLSEEDVLPVGASSYGRTLFLMVRSNRPNAGQVSWISDEEVDRYTDFAEFFASITQYFKQHVEQLRSGT